MSEAVEVHPSELREGDLIEDRVRHCPTTVRSVEETPFGYRVHHTFGMATFVKYPDGIAFPARQQLARRY